jgi:hypothetical protein
MNNFLAIFNAFPAILGAVQAVEAAVPLPQSGQQKLNLVLGAAATAWEVSQLQQQLSKNQMMNAAGAMASLAVAGLNAAGVFRKGITVSGTPVSSN